MPAPSSTVFVKCLSMPIAEASTPLPTYGQPDQLEQALDGAVLAEPAVQDREDDVDVAEGALARGIRHAQLARCRALGPAHAGAVVDDLGQVLGVEGEPLGVVGLEHERAVAGDPDGDHLVPVTVDRPEHPSRRCAADRVLA